MQFTSSIASFVGNIEQAPDNHFSTSTYQKQKNFHQILMNDFSYFGFIFFNNTT
jgi:hypothetical protein